MRPHNKRVPDDELANAYQRLGNVWKVAQEVGLSGQSVYERLGRMGVITRMRVFTEEEVARIQQDYAAYRDQNRLDELSQEMGRTKQFLCRKAREMGLTDRQYPKVKASVWKYMTEADARVLFDRFVNSPLGLSGFCAKNNLSALGFWRTMSTLWPAEYDSAIEGKVQPDGGYGKGRALEYRTAALLGAYDFAVMVSHRSRSPVDLVAVKTGLLLFVQCKCRGTLPVSEWNALWDLSVSVGGVSILASAPDGVGVVFERLVERKDGTKRPQPKVLFMLA